MKTVFVVLYGLLGLVPTDKELWVLMPDATALSHANGSHGEQHYADIAIRSGDEAFARVVTLQGEDVAVGAGNGEVKYHEREKLIFLNEIPVENARVDPNCIIAHQIDKCVGANGKPLLAGRVRLAGPVRVAPFYVTRSQSTPFGVYGNLVRREGKDDRSWAFRSITSARRVGTHDGNFGDAMVAVITVPAETKEIAFPDALPLQLANVNIDKCQLYARDVGMKPLEISAMKSCSMIWISNQPIRVDAQRDALTESRDHTELLFDLLANKRQPRVALYRRSQTLGGAGDPPGSVCIGTIFDP